MKFYFWKWFLIIFFQFSHHWVKLPKGEKQKQNWPNEPNKLTNLKLARRWTLTWSKSLWKHIISSYFHVWSIRSSSPLENKSAVLYQWGLWGLMIKELHMCLKDPGVHRWTTEHMSTRASANSVPSFVPMVIQMSHICFRFCFKNMQGCKHAPHDCSLIWALKRSTKEKVWLTCWWHKSQLYITAWITVGKLWATLTLPRFPIPVGVSPQCSAFLTSINRFLPWDQINLPFSRTHSVCFVLEVFEKQQRRNCPSSCRSVFWHLRPTHFLLCNSSYVIGVLCRTRCQVGDY